MNESTFEILATTLLESRVQYMSDRIFDAAVSRVENECLFNNGVEYERKKDVRNGSCQNHSRTSYRKGR